MTASVSEATLGQDCHQDLYRNHHQSLERITSVKSLAVLAIRQP